jgi:hypothetical protein
MLYSYIIAVCSEIYTKHTNTLCGQNVELSCVKPGGIYSNHCVSTNSKKHICMCASNILWAVIMISSPPSSAVGHERVELYLYSPYGLYGLYRASVPVQGWLLPFTVFNYDLLNLYPANVENRVSS